MLLEEEDDDELEVILCGRSAYCDGTGFEFWGRWRIG